MPDQFNHDRRRLLAAAAAGIAAAELGMANSVAAQPTTINPIKPGANTSFAALKQIDAGVLNVGYAEAGPALVLPSSFCTAGPTTSTASSMWRPCWRRRVTG